jgi:hypothetical protein
MTRILARKDPTAFKTAPLCVEAREDRLTYRSLGEPLSFAKVIERRRPVHVDNPVSFDAALTNLGVSVRLSLRWRGQDHWLVVRQQRPDRGDTVLKLISGYVPAQELNLPLLTATQEVAEECLIETDAGWLTGRFAETWLPTPYRGRLHHRDDCHFNLQPLSGAALPVYAGSLQLLERPRAYVHLPTASLQLVYDMLLELPQKAHQPSLFHVDEKLEDGSLIARLHRRRQDIFLIPLKQGQPSGELLTLNKGQLKPASLRGVYLSESFCSKDGWVIRDDRIGWKAWLQQINSSAS